MSPSPSPVSSPPAVRPYALVVPYSKCQRTEDPLGSTVPLSVAVERLIPVAAPVVAAGGPAPRATAAGSARVSRTQRTNKWRIADRQHARGTVVSAGRCYG